MALLQETAPAKQAEASAMTPEMLKQAVAAGVITFLLASLIVGIETVSSTGALDFTTRYKEVFIATIGVFVGSLVISQMRAGRPQVGVVVAGGVSVLLLVLLLVQERDLIPEEFLPFKSMIINWGSLIIPVAIFLRSSQEMRKQRALARGQVVASKNVAEAFQRAMPWIGAAMIVLAVALPWLPL